MNYQQNLKVFKSLLGNKQFEFEVKQIETITVLEKPWFMINGTKFPEPAKINDETSIRIANLTPNEATGEDRIIDQLMFVPPNYEEIKQRGKLKTILLYNGLIAWNVVQGHFLFLSES